jgi:16S rRNA (uracil1498-N3)-methyltransferase
VIAHPGGVRLGELALSQLSATQFAIGPEGGFADEEVSVAIAAGWQPVDLGPRILRVETAAVGLAAAIAMR